MKGAGVIQQVGAGVTRVKMPKTEYDMAPKVVRYPVCSEEEVWKLKLPDIKTTGSLPMTMELSKLQQAVPRMPITAPSVAVLTLAGAIVNAENLCK